MVAERAVTVLLRRLLAPALLAKPLLCLLPPCVRHAGGIGLRRLCGCDADWCVLGFICAFSCCLHRRLNCRALHARESHRGSRSRDSRWQLTSALFSKTRRWPGLTITPSWNSSPPRDRRRKRLRCRVNRSGVCMLSEDWDGYLGFSALAKAMRQIYGA